MFIQIVEIATVIKAYFESVNQFKGTPPKNLIISLITPKLGWNINRTIDAEAEIETPRLEEKIVLKNPIPFIFSLHRIAKKRAIVILKNTVITANLKVAKILK